MSISTETRAELVEIAARYPQKRSGLLPMLHLVQSSEGRITPEGIEVCAEILDISAADVSGVATFYTMYKRRPVGDYHVGVCTNTLCAVMGGDEIFARLKDHLDVGNDETTDDAPKTRHHPRARRVQRGLRLRPGDDGQLGVHGQHDPRLGHRPRRRPARRTRGPLHARAADLHLARGRAGARRLPRRPRRRGPRRRTGVAGRPGHRPRARLDGAPSAATRLLPATRRRPCRGGRGQAAGRRRAATTTWPRRPTVEEQSAERPRPPPRRRKRTA